MKKVVNKEKYLHLFREYKHNIPVIYSSLEGQYDGELFAEINDNQMQLWMEYIAGVSGSELTIDMLEQSAQELGCFQGRTGRSGKTDAESLLLQ